MPEDNTHKVSSRLTYLYSAPDMKSVPVTKLSFSSTVAPLARQEGRFVELSRGGFIFADHLVGIRERAKDFVRVAERLVGVPYLWGGKTPLGIDCSGLVQLALQAAGVPCLRDSDMQMANAGEPIDPSNLDAVQRGDLLFWKGHVAIAQSGEWLIHASGHHMEVVVEQMRRAVDRIAEAHGPLLAVLRPSLEAQQAPQHAPSPQNAREPGKQPLPSSGAKTSVPPPAPAPSTAPAAAAPSLPPAREAQTQPVKGGEAKSAAGAAMTPATLEGKVKKETADIRPFQRPPAKSGRT